MGERFVVGVRSVVMQAHLRVARATDHLDEILRFYSEGLDFTRVGEFHDREGFDGVMLGHPGTGYHLAEHAGVPLVDLGEFDLKGVPGRPRAFGLA